MDGMNMGHELHEFIWRKGREGGEEKIFIRR